ncbi:MAG: HD domain-containing protein [Clostridiales bacterium]|nr:HD domain-containing protein [Clostridiales bacterium]
MELIGLFNEVDKHLLLDEKPSLYLERIKNNKEFNIYPFSQLKALEKIMQSSKHHPEGNVWIHTMMVIDKGATLRDKANDKRAFMWSLLLHDLGKIKTTKLRNGRLTSYDHDRVSEEESIKFLNSLTDNEEFIKKVSKLTRYHMHLLYIMKNMPFADEKGMVKYVDINDISLVFLSDRLGRGGVTKDDKNKIENEVTKFINKFNKVNS